MILGGACSIPTHGPQVENILYRPSCGCTDQSPPCFHGRDILCGKLLCSRGNDNPNYGRMVKFGECKAAFFNEYSSVDRGQVDPGSKCGEGKVTWLLLL